MLDRTKFPPLNFPLIDAKVKSESGVTYVFDSIRKKFVKLTPEEWVRQHTIGALITEAKVPASHLMVESELRYHQVRKRPDIGILGQGEEIWMVVECKAPQVNIDEDVWQQAVTYASVLRPRFIMLTNGLRHIYCEFRPELKNFVFIKEMPVYGS